MKTLLLLPLVLLSSCATSLEGLTKDERRVVILERAQQESIWSKLGVGIATGLGNAAVGWVSAQALPDNRGLKK